jgi:hypothetical protein
VDPEGNFRRRGFVVAKFGKTEWDAACETSTNCWNIPSNPKNRRRKKICLDRVCNRSSTSDEDSFEGPLSSKSCQDMNKWGEFAGFEDCESFCEKYGYDYRECNNIDVKCKNRHVQMCLSDPSVTDSLQNYLDITVDIGTPCSQVQKATFHQFGCDGTESGELCDKCEHHHYGVKKVLGGCGEPRMQTSCPFALPQVQVVPHALPLTGDGINWHASNFYDTLKHANEADHVIENWGEVFFDCEDRGPTPAGCDNYLTNCSDGNPYEDTLTKRADASALIRHCWNKFRGETGNPPW